MNWNQLLKEWKIWILIIFIIGSIAAIGPHYSEDEQGNIIIDTNINKGLDIKGGARLLAAPQGNVTEDDMEQILTTLKMRIDAYGLQETKIRPISGLDKDLVQLEMAGASNEQLRGLIEKQGNFEARIPYQVGFNESFQVGENTYEITELGEEVEIGEKEVETGESFVLDSHRHNVSFKITNKTSEGVNLSALAFSGSDVDRIPSGAEYSQVTQRGGNWRFQFQVDINSRSAERFNDICQNLDIDVQPGGGNDGDSQPGGGNDDDSYLSSNLNLYLDGNLSDSLRIGGVFKEQVIDTPSITGGGESQEDARRQMDQLKSILRSGALPVPIEVSSVSSVSATLGEEFFSVAFIAIFAAVIAVSVVIFVRYRKPKIALPILITGLSEVLVLLAFFSSGSLNVITASALLIPTAIGVGVCFKEDIKAVVTLPFAALFSLGLLMVPSSLDLAAIAGIIAAVGTGVDDQVIITDEGSRKKLKSLKARIKRAFFIIFTSAASTIGAMIPLTFIGAGAVRGFAITTIVGIIIGITVTRPAYAKVLEYIE